MNLKSITQSGFVQSYFQIKKNPEINVFCFCSVNVIQSLDTNPLSGFLSFWIWELLYAEQMQRK